MARRRILHTNGYMTVFLPEHPDAMANGYVYEHRLVLEKKLGRGLLPGEQAHHRDGNKQNNHPDNLESKNIRAHTSDHFKKRRDLQGLDESNQRIKCACGCGKLLWRYDATGRPRSFLSGHNPNLANTPWAQERILKFLAAGPQRTGAIIVACGISGNTLLSFMKRAGLVRHLKHGVWSLP